MAETARERPEHAALLFKGARMSCGELERLRNAFAATLAHLGVQKGDRVAFVLPNCPQAVAGVPDERQGEVVKAWIIVRDGQQVTADEIRAPYRKDLAGYKVPKHVEFRDTLPKTMVGKVLRRKLVDNETAPRTQ
jgi:acyl-CoA synthetase (AMP-forming)/AMP-acid ligase II